MAFIAWPQALKSDEKHIFFLAPYGTPRCHGTLSILSITHGNHMKGLGIARNRGHFAPSRIHWSAEYVILQ